MTSLRLRSIEPVIGIDGSRLGLAHRTGTETYAWETLRAMARIAPDLPVRLYLNDYAVPEELPKEWQRRSIPFPRLWTHVRLSLEMAKHPPALLWIPAHVVPANHPRSIVTIHDLGYLHHPEGHTDRQRRMLDLTTRWSARVADRIIAVSDLTRRDLMERYRVPDDRIRVIPHGVSDRFKPAHPNEVAAVRTALGIEGPYVLAVGTVQPRKNYDGLARAMSELSAQGYPHQLVIAGKPGWLADSVHREVAAARLGDRVRFLDYVSAEQLPALYSAADVVAFPSWYEGFGLPALEAMACGAPVIVSNRGALPEIVGDAGVIFDPGDDSALASTIIQVVSDQAFREALIARGHLNVAPFSWHRTAALTLELLTERSGITGQLPWSW